MWQWMLIQVLCCHVTTLARYFLEDSKLGQLYDISERTKGSHYSTTFIWTAWKSGRPMSTNEYFWAGLSYSTPRNGQTAPEIKKLHKKWTFVFVIKIVRHTNKVRPTRDTEKSATYSVTVQLRFSNTVKKVFRRTVCPIKFHRLTARILTTYLNHWLF